MLSKIVFKLLHFYLKEYTPHYYLFQGQDSAKEKPLTYSERSIQAVLAKAVTNAGIQKHITVNTLRQSFATCLLENRIDLLYIQSPLGHESSKATAPIAIEIYTCDN